MLDRQSIIEGVSIRILDPAGMLVLTGDGPDWAPRTNLLAAGDLLTVDEAVLDANLDRRGDSWLFLADEPEWQQARWGHVRFQLASDDYTPEPVRQEDSRYVVRNQTTRVYRDRSGEQESPWGFKVGSR